MNYEQKYNDLINRLREYRKRFGNPLYKEIGEEFPELTESEDERIRKKMIEHFKSKTKDTWCNIPVKSILAYLEKKKELKPNIELIQRSWYMEGYTDGEFKREPMWNLVTGKGGPRYEKNEKYGQPLEQKPVEWSDEDMRKLNRIYEILSHAADDKGFLTSKRIIGDKEAIELQDFLKSLRPSWKPSEEQMKELGKAKDMYMKSSSGIASLYYDLKTKLM